MGLYDKWQMVFQKDWSTAAFIKKKIIDTEIYEMAPQP